MKTERKNNWMVWAIVVLTVMNISTFATIFYHQNQSIKEEIVNDPTQQISENTAKNYSGRYFRDKLNMDQRQMNRFRGFNPTFRQQVMTINLKLSAIRKQMLDEMVAENSDTLLLNMLSDSVGILHSQLKKFTYKYYLEMKNICSKDQQKQLEQIFNEMFTNDMPMGRSGQGGQRWRHGRGNRN